MVCFRHILCVVPSRSSISLLLCIFRGEVLSRPGVGLAKADGSEIPAAPLQFSFPKAREHGTGMMSVFQNGLRFHAPLATSAFGCCELRLNPLPDVEVSRIISAGRVANGKLGHLD